MFMNVLCYPGHSSSRCYMVGNWTCFNFCGSNWRSLLEEGWNVLKKLKEVQLPKIQHLKLHSSNVEMCKTHIHRLVQLQKYIKTCKWTWKMRKLISTLNLKRFYFINEILFNLWAALSFCLRQRWLENATWTGTQMIWNWTRTHDLGLVNNHCFKSG